MWSESGMEAGGNDAHKYRMELDLGECMLQFMTSDNEAVNKTTMAFRSLEISALVE